MTFPFKHRRPRVLVLEAGSDSGVDVVRALDKIADVFPADADRHCRVGWHSNFLQVKPAASDLDYVQSIRDLCDVHAIDFIAPTVFHHAEDLTYVRPGLHPSESYYFDDKLAYQNLWREKLPVADTVLSTEIPDMWQGHELVLKPRYGKGSRYVQFLKSYSGKGDPSFVAQPYHHGPQFTVDVLTHPVTGAFVHAVVRQVHQLRNGTDTVATILPSGHPLEHTAIRLAQRLGWKGPANFEVIGETIIDINPRFSASYRMSEVAGSSFVLNWLDGLLYPGVALVPGVRRKTPLDVVRFSEVEVVNCDN